MTRPRRPDGFFPTDPYAAAAARAWLEREHPTVLGDTWVDPCAGYGGLVEGLGVPIASRYAIELEGRHRPELERRVPSSQVVIGDGLTNAWNARHVAMNPDFANGTMTAFVRRALTHQDRTGGLVLVLALATWWHSDALRTRGDGLRRPSRVLVPDRRVSCDGTGRGDMRAIDWLVWEPGQTRTEVVWLPPATPDPALVSEHRRLALLGAL